VGTPAGRSFNIMRGKYAPLAGGTRAPKEEARAAPPSNGPGFAPHISHYVKCPPTATVAAAKSLRGWVYLAAAQPAPARPGHRLRPRFSRCASCARGLRRRPPHPPPKGAPKSHGNSHSEKPQRARLHAERERSCWLPSEGSAVLGAGRDRQTALAPRAAQPEKHP
jgi:hypothetical protein